MLLSRLENLDPALGEALLQPGEPLFEYWGHEASWIPLALYPAFDFRRREFIAHPWWGDLVAEHPKVAKDLRRRLRDDGPLRSLDMEGQGGRGWWDLKIAKRVATALWSSGELAVRERRNFQRTFDLAERVIPDAMRARPLPEDRCIETLLLKALDGHGWATTGTLAATWRLKNRGPQLRATLHRLAESGVVTPCELRADGERPASGWIRTDDLELASRLERVRPRRDRGVLLSPFDPVLWDRARVRRLFDFDQVLEIFKPAAQRQHGYFCLPVLAGERLIARFDLKAHRQEGRLAVLSAAFESTGSHRPGDAAEARAAETALGRYAEALELRRTGWRAGRAGT